MKRNRLTIAGMMTLIVFAAIGFAALRRPTLLWASTLFTVTVLLLSTAVIGAMARKGRGRLMWAGAVVFGWAYLLIAFGLGSTGNGATPPPFLTKALIDSQRKTQWNQATTVNNSPVGEEVPEGPLIYPSDSTNVPTVPGSASPRPIQRVEWFIDLLNQRRIGHCLSAILFAAIGAGVGRLLAAKEERGEAR